MRLWQSRFAGGLHPEALAFSSSLAVDGRLYAEDIEGSLAHVTMLAQRGIIPSRDAARIRKALRAVKREIASGSKPLRVNGAKGGRFVAEDVHMAVEQRVIDKVGVRGGMLHTARSRNDQIALDERLYLRTAGRTIITRLSGLERALAASAQRHIGVIMPGYTHLQRAQPVLLAHHLLAYVAMLERDKERFRDCLRRADASPLGAAALAGTSFPIDRRSVARTVRLQGIVENSIDAVSDRDAVIEFVAGGAITMMHLSRLAEELVLWSSREWGFAEIGDAFTTGSSIMPQKKNPDMAELVRGKTGRVYGSLIALLTMMKALPLAYNRDMQEDKEPLFDTADTLAVSLRIMTLMVSSTKFNRNRFEAELRSDMLLATELADYLVRKRMPFRSAHAIVGSIVKTCLSRSIQLHELPLAEYRRFCPLFARDIAGLFDPRASILRKRSAGSTSPREVVQALRKWQKVLRR
jgi:argininosuccinate lyase